MESHTPIQPAPKYRSPKIQGYMTVVDCSRPDCSRLVIQGPHNLLKADVNLLYPSQKIYWQGTPEMQSEECYPWSSTRRPSHLECEILNDWRQRQTDNLCNGRHRTVGQAIRCTGATRPNGPRWIPTPMLDERRLKKDSNMRGMNRGTSSRSYSNVTKCARPPIPSTVPVYGGGARPRVRAYLNDKYPTVRAQLNTPCQPMRGGPGPVLPEHPAIRVGRIVTPDSTIFKMLPSKDNPRAQVQVHPAPTSSSEDDVPDLVEAEASQFRYNSPQKLKSLYEGPLEAEKLESFPPKMKGPEEQAQMDRLFYCSKYEDFYSDCQKEILSRMKGDVDLAKKYYTEYVLSGYNIQEMEEHLKLTLTNFDQREREYDYAVSIRKCATKEKISSDETDLQRHMMNRWKADLIELMRAINPNVYFNWLPRPTQVEISRRVDGQECLKRYYVNDICKGMSIRQIQQHLDETRYDTGTRKWELQQCRMKWKKNISLRIQARGDRESTLATIANHKRIVVDPRANPNKPDNLLHIGVKGINKSIRSFQEMRQDFQQELNQVIDLTKENSLLLNTFLCKPQSHAPATVTAAEAAAAAAVQVPEGPSPTDTLSQPKASPQHEEQSQAKTDTQELVRDLMDTGIIDKSVFQPENWAQAPEP